VSVGPEAGDRAPTIISQPVTEANYTLRLPYTYKVDALDPDNDPLTYSLTTAPAGMTIDRNTGLITWTPTYSLDPVSVTVRVEDGRGGFDTQSFAINVRGVAPGRIFGTLFNDLNGNGVRDAGEPPLAGWRVYLDQNQNGRRDSYEQFATTDQDGRYLFELVRGT